MAHALDKRARGGRGAGRRSRDILFVLVGEGAEKERLVARARALGLGNVEFVGQQPKARGPALLRRLRPRPGRRCATRRSFAASCRRRSSSTWGWSGRSCSRSTATRGAWSRRRARASSCRPRTSPAWSRRSRGSRTSRSCAPRWAGAAGATSVEHHDRAGARAPLPRAAARGGAARGVIAAGGGCSDADRPPPANQ